MKTEKELREIGKKVLFDYDIKHGYVTVIKANDEEKYYLTPFGYHSEYMLQLNEKPMKLENLLDYYTDHLRDCELETHDGIDKVLGLINEDKGYHSDGFLALLTKELKI